LTHHENQFSFPRCRKQFIAVSTAQAHKPLGYDLFLSERLHGGMDKL
jgi:hypothetical protein